MASSSVFSGGKDPDYSEHNAEQFPSMSAAFAPACDCLGVAAHHKQNSTRNDVAKHGLRWIVSDVMLLWICAVCLKLGILLGCGQNLLEQAWQVACLQSPDACRLPACRLQRLLAIEQIWGLMTRRFTPKWGAHA